jgi:hypothetical protein
MLYWQFVNGTANEIWNQAEVLTAPCYGKPINTLLPSWVQSKLFSVGIPKSQSPETNAKFAITPKKIISNMLFLIPVFHVNMWYVDCLFLSFPSHSEHSDTQLWYIGCSPSSCIRWSQTAASPSFSRLYNFFLILRVPNFMFQLRAEQKVSSNCTYTIW